MRALLFDDSEARVAEVAEPQACDESVLVRVSLAGVCNTDLEIVKGYMQFRGILGHEFVGRVEAGPSEWRGQRVVGEINFACRSCPICAQGMHRHCPSRAVMGMLDADGAFAELVRLPVTNLHPVPDSVADEIAVFTEPLAAAFEILEQTQIEPGQRCVVLGDGKLGLLVAQVLHQAGASVLAVGKHPEKLAILGKRGIATALASEWNGERASLVVEATGTAEGFARAVAATRPCGTLVLKSTVSECPSLDLSPIVVDEIRVVGSRCGPFPPALRALETGSVDVGSLISHRVALDDAVEGLRKASQPGVLKVLIEP
ncbi:MAG: alcohol dehydrogenase catalytic domain-containing protein [Deltaproteobacteria bacterium]|nr:alcohol dehydrogenase catalytic domain-containing protein [Deltaproteobacteria bacterium]